MKNLFVSALLAGVVAVSASTASAQAPVIQETFDTYTTLADMNSVWNSDAANYVLMTDGGHSGSNYVRTLGNGTTGPSPTGRFSRTIALTASDAAPIEVSFWTRVSSTASGRSYMQLEAPSTQLINFGQFNNPGGSQWNYRTLGGGAPGQWKNDTIAQVADIWTNLKVIVESRRVTYYINDTQVAQEARTVDDWPTFTAIRFGFSTSTSAINVDFDDITVRQLASVNDWNLY